MKILLIHNKYGKYSGEEAVVDAQLRLLRDHGHEADLFTRSSEEIPHLKLKSISAFFSGFYNSHSIRLLKQKLSEKNYDVVHIHNLYPLISPAILPVITSKKYNSSTHKLISSPPKLVMTVHNYRLICPNGLFFTQGEICERCTGGKEYMCIVKNCENSLFKSTGYAMRNWWARKRKYYLSHVDAFLCLTDFQRSKLMENGFPGERCHVLQNFMDPGPAGAQASDCMFVLFAGRVNRQKGIGLLASAAALLPHIPFTIAGAPDKGYLQTFRIPGNMTLAGEQPKEQMEELFRQASFLVFTSRSYEGFPMVFLEAMKHHIPVIAPRQAGFPEIIGDGFNGLLFEPGDAEDLARKITRLWGDKAYCMTLGKNGFELLSRMYSPELYYERLLDVYLK
jgi:glycosyltransferase involved in cell wall biosynthesis